MKKNVIALALICSAPLANIAHADQAGWYLGAGFGQSKLSDWATKQDIYDTMNAAASDIGVTTFTGTSSANTDDTDTGYKVFTGYSFNPNLAVEISYIDFGNATAKGSSSGAFGSVFGNGTGSMTISAKGEATALTLDGIGKVPVGQYVDLFGRVGIFSAHTKVSAKVSLASTVAQLNGTGSDSTSKTSQGLHFGVGADAKVADHVKLRVEWERLNDVKLDSKFDIDLLSASVIYAF